MVNFIIGGICGIIVGIIAGVFMLSILAMNKLDEDEN